MRLQAKMFALLLSLLCLLAPLTSQAQWNSAGGASNIDWSSVRSTTDPMSLLVEAAVAMGLNTTDVLTKMSQAEKDNLVAQYMAKNEQQYNAYMDNLAIYVKALDQIQSNQGTTIDYDAMAQELGLAPGTYTPADLTNRLNQIKNIYDALLSDQQAAAASGLSTGLYMRYLLGYTQSNGAYCGGRSTAALNSYNYMSATPEQFYGTDVTNCLTDVKNQINTIINAPPIVAPVTGPTEEERQQQLAEEQRLAQENAQLLQQYNDFANEIQKYHDLLNEVNTKIQNAQDIDWNAIAQQLGIEPSTPDDTYKRLQELNSYYDAWNQNAKARAVSGQSPQDYMRWLLGQTTDANGKTCAELNACYTQTRTQWDGILNRGSIKPPSGISGSNTDFFDLSYLMGKFHTQLPALIHLLYALSYTIGVLLVIIGVFKLKEYGESASSQQSRPGVLTSCLSFTVAGIMLIYLPTALQVGTATFLADSGDNSLFSYTVAKNTGYGYEELIAPVVDIVKIVGLLAFIRGWIMLSKMGNDQHKGTMFKGIVHVIAGILAINILAVYTLFAKIVGRLF